jgi:hypothetical protein
MTYFTPDVRNINGFPGKALFYLEVIRTALKTLGVSLMSGHDVAIFVARQLDRGTGTRQQTLKLSEQMIVTKDREKQTVV